MKPLTKAIKISSSLQKVYNIFNKLILYSTARLKHAYIPTPSTWTPEVQVYTVICVCKTIMMPREFYYIYIYINLHMPKYLKLDFMLKQYIAKLWPTGFKFVCKNLSRYKMPHCRTCSNIQATQEIKCHIVATVPMFKIHKKKD